MKSSMSSLARSRRLDGEAADGAAVETGAHLEGLELERALLVAARAQALRHRVLEPQVLGEALDGRQRRGHLALALQPRPDRRVGELGVVAHEGAAHVLRHHRAAGVDRHPDDDGEAVLTGVQRREVRAQAVGQHGEDARRRVDGGRVDAGVRVDGRARRDGRAHVGDRDQDPDAAVHLALGDGELVEVEGVVVVDGAPEQSAQVGGRPRRPARPPAAPPASASARAGNSGSRPYSTIASRATRASRSRCWSEGWFIGAPPSPGRRSRTRPPA